jgi:putative PIN family toxin of toxin-antitoxin system
MLKITLDTNVLVSATFWTGDSFKIIKIIETQEIACVLSPHILFEYYKVLCSEEIVKKQQQKQLAIQQIVQHIIAKTTLIIPKKVLAIVQEDPDDDHILACGQEGKVNFIITQDHHLLRIKKYHDITIVSPQEFLDYFLSQATSSLYKS